MANLFRYFCRGNKVLYLVSDDRTPVPPEVRRNIEPLTDGRAIDTDTEVVPNVAVVINQVNAIGYSVQDGPVVKFKELHPIKGRLKK